MILTLVNTEKLKYKEQSKWTNALLLNTEDLINNFCNYSTLRISVNVTIAFNEIWNDK